MSMVICKALGRIRTREGGVRVLYEKGETLTLSREESLRLKGLKVVEILETLDEEDFEQKYLSQEDLEPKNKDELIEYAETIGLKLEKSMKRDALINSIVDYISEQQEISDENI